MNDNNNTHFINLNQTMRQVRLLPVLLLTLLLSSCNDTLLIKDVGTKEQGALSLNLSMDSGTLMSKADGTDGGEMTAQDTLDNFKVEIYRKVSDDMKDGIRLYKALYVDAKDDLIPLDAGDYYLRAKFGDSLGIGFDRPFLMAEQSFTVRPQTRENVSAVAKIANVKVSVNFGDYFQEYYPDYYVKVINNDSNLIGYRNSLTFNKDEERCGFIHHGEMTVEVYADFKGDGKWSYYQLSGIDADNDGTIADNEKFRYSPNDHITFDIDAADKLYGNLLVNIKIENGTDDKTYQTEVPEYKAPQDGPKASRQGFDVTVGGNDGYAYVYEGREPEYNDGQSFSYSAKAGLKSCVLNISSEYLKNTYGLDGAYTLASLSSDDVTVVPNSEVVTELEAAGIRCSMGKFMGIVDFTEAMKLIGKNSVYTSDTTPCAVFSLTVTDESGATASTSGNMLVWPLMAGTFEIPDYDVWGWKVTAPVVNLTKGKAEYCQLQFSDNGKDWTVVQNSGAVNGLKVTFADHMNLEPDTDYWFRAYDPIGDVQVGNIAKVHTESAQQLGNPSFEEYRVQEFTFRYKKVVWFGNWTYDARYWYELYSSDSSQTQWATNSSATLDYEVTPQYLYYKCYPTITLQKGGAAVGNYSVMIASVATTDYGSDALSGDAKTGEVWIGSADNSAEHKGGHVENGDAFTSRPSKMTFQHKFSQHDNDPYYVEVQVWDSGKNVIGKGTISSAVSVEPDWTLAEVPITYTAKNKKAAYIYVSFKSSATGSTASRKFQGATGLPNTHIDANGNSANNDPIHAGSILWVDDVRLEYNE